MLLATASPSAISFTTLRRNAGICMLSRSLVLPSGTTVSGRYRVERKLGEGGMGIVYEVVHLNTGQRMALKTLREIDTSNPELLARFANESRLTAAIKSEHIVKVTDADTDAERGIPFFVMELLEGNNLAGLIREGRRFTAREVVKLLAQASLALDKTHAIDIVHRDLKPENLFLTIRDDGSECLKILDFGIAKVVAPGTYANVTRNLGTLLYMSPEQYEGDPHIDRRTDIYSLGQVAFTLLVGHPYWEPEAKALGALVRSIAQGAPEPASRRARRCWNVELPSGFDDWFAKATAKDAGARFDSASELVEELAVALGTHSGLSGTPVVRSVARPPDTSASARATRGGARRLMGVTAAVVLGFGATALLLQGRERSPSPEIRPSVEIPSAGAASVQPASAVEETAVRAATPKMEELVSDPGSLPAASAGPVSSGRAPVDPVQSRAGSTAPSRFDRGASAPARPRIPNENAASPSSAQHQRPASDHF
jgi:serine/threonine protein kinase